MDSCNFTEKSAAKQNYPSVKNPSYRGSTLLEWASRKIANSGSRKFILAKKTKLFSCFFLIWNLRVELLEICSITSRGFLQSCLGVSGLTGISDFINIFGIGKNDCVFQGNIKNYLWKCMNNSKHIVNFFSEKKRMS